MLAQSAVGRKSSSHIGKIDVGTKSTELSESDQLKITYANSKECSRGVTVREDDAVLGVISLLDDFVQEPGSLSSATNEQIRKSSTCQPVQEKLTSNMMAGILTG